MSKAFARINKGCCGSIPPGEQLLPERVKSVRAHIFKLKIMKTRRQIFKEVRTRDDSNLWPVSGRFNLADRAIRRLYKFENQYGERLDGLELELWLENEMTQIVNKL